jgi:Phosphorylase superfamily
MNGCQTGTKRPICMSNLTKCVLLVSVMHGCMVLLDLRAHRASPRLMILAATWGRWFARACQAGSSVSHCFAGRFNGVPVSIVTTLMGMPNMDFVVRECRAVVDGQMAVVRLGTCGGVDSETRLGDVVVASKGSVCVRCVCGWAGGWVGEGEAFPGQWPVVEHAD